MYLEYDNNKAYDIICLDLQKALDTMPHKKLMIKVQALGIGGSIEAWIENWLTEKTELP